jgi:hypothetical protein
MCSSSWRPLVHAVFYGMFFIQLCKQSSRWKTAYINERKTYCKKMHVQMVFLMINIWCSKHAEDTKNWIKTFEKCTFVGLHHISVSQCTVQKKNIKKIPILTLVNTHINSCWTLWTTPLTWTITLARMPIHICECVCVLATVNWASVTNM